ncbi:MAG TPA: biotin/lipoyl-binding protein [Epsilonproteobacteria bacterium]|nr:biotin/lipoyl-binding protein [Campylobacterota bacterium]
MKQFYTVLFLAILGIVTGVATIFYGNAPAEAKTKPILTIQPPFPSYVAGTGMVEASSTNISVGTPVSGIITKLAVNVGDHVKAGDLLFIIDDREIEAKLIRAHAKVFAAQASLQKPMHLLQIAKRLKALNPQAISKEVLTKRQDDAAQAKADLALANAEVAALETLLERYRVRALFSGIILQCKMRVGAYAQAGNIAPPLLVLGSDTMNLRVDVNEYDVWRTKPHAKAVAFVRGHPELKIALDYAYTEPYIIPKTALSGQSTERTDTRVLQVIYKIKGDGFPLYAGEQLDVFIQTDENSTGKGSA